MRKENVLKCVLEIAIDLFWEDLRRSQAGHVVDSGSTPGSRRSPGRGNGNPLQCFCLENFMDRGTCWAAVHGAAKSQT